MIFWAAAIAALVWILVLGKGLTFFYDEWDFINTASGSYWHNFFASHGGHPQMIPYTVYRVLLNTVGLGHYWPYRLLVALLDLTCGWLLFATLRRRIHPVLAACLAAILMILGPAWQDLLWPFQIGFLGSVAAGLGCLLLLDRPTTHADRWACACLVIAVGCSGIAIPFMVGVAVELLWQRSWRRLWIPAFPGALFAIWYVLKGRSGTSTNHYSAVLHAVPAAAANAVGAVVGRGTHVGYALLGVVGVVAVLAALWRTAGVARLLMAGSGAIAFWTTSSLARGSINPYPSRYLYPGAVFVLLFVAELGSLVITQSNPLTTVARRRSGPALRLVLSRGLLWLTPALAGAIIWSNAADFAQASASLLGTSRSVAAELAGVQLAGTHLPSSFQPDSARMPQVTVGPYLKAAAAFGAPAPRPLLKDAAELDRLIVDGMLLRGHVLAAAQVPAPTSCLPLSATLDGGFALPSSGALITAPSDLTIEVFARAEASDFRLAPFARISPGTTILVRWRRGADPNIDWHLSVSQPSLLAPNDLCAGFVRASVGQP